MGKLDERNFILNRDVTAFGAICLAFVDDDSSDRIVCVEVDEEESFLEFIDGSNCQVFNSVTQLHFLKLDYVRL